MATEKNNNTKILDLFDELFADLYDPQNIDPTELPELDDAEDIREYLYHGISEFQVPIISDKTLALSFNNYTGFYYGNKLVVPFADAQGNAGFTVLNRDKTVLAEFKFEDYPYDDESDEPDVDEIATRIMIAVDEANKEKSF